MSGLKLFPLPAIEKRNLKDVLISENIFSIKKPANDLIKNMLIIDSLQKKLFSNLQ